MKTYVITLSKKYPAYHIKKGLDTNFEQSLLSGLKKHTIRGNYNFWKKRIDEINSGNAILSIRQWIDKPYKKPGQIEIMQLKKAGIQKCNVSVNKETDAILIEVDGMEKIFAKNDIITNDGLTWQDFRSWFKHPIDGGCIIHFTDLKY